MNIIRSETLKLQNSDDIVRVRQAVRSWMVEMKFSLLDQTKMVTAASELARNAVQHGGGGNARLEALENGASLGLRLVFTDHGPGIPDLELALKDGYTTVGGLGLGLSGSKRLVNEFDIWSVPGEGTRVTVVRWREKDLKRLHVVESSQVGEARRLAASMGRELELDEVRVEHVSIVVTELATNLVKHAGGGDLILRALQVSEACGIEALSLDKGPGIRNIGESMRDGYSTMGSPGTGLGAIQRLSSLFDIYSRPGQGTAVLSRIWRQPLPASAPLYSLEMGVVCLPVWTEEACGDAWALHQSRERTLVLLADGLGHGRDAAEASTAAANIFQNHTDDGPAEMIDRMHAALRITRGAAVAVTEVLWSKRIVRYAGVGNVSGRILAGDAVRNMVSHNGTVGVEARKIEEVSYPWPDDGLLVLHTDGLAIHWSLDDYPGLRGRNPALIAGVLFRDHSRARDDSTVVVIRETGSSL